MKNLLLSKVITLSVSICLLFTMSVMAMSYASQPSVPDADLSNPFCGQITPDCPFFDPCPEGSHIDMACAEACCRTYKSAVTNANDLACLLYENVISDYIDGLETISIESLNCLNSGVSLEICMALRQASIDLLDKDLEETKLAIRHILEGKLQRALDRYFDCLLSCPCIEDTPTPQ